MAGRLRTASAPRRRLTHEATSKGARRTITAFLQTGEDSRILGIATLHRAPMQPPGSFAAAAGVASKAAREESSALLCAEFMHHLGELGAGDGVSQIDWVMVRASDTTDSARSHLGATRVAGVALKPYAPGEAGDDATAAGSSAAGRPAA
jgi:hypothetical protein